jgi:hypothetical protein
VFARRFFYQHCPASVRDAIASALLALTQPIRDHRLGRLLRGRRALVLGSGPSAADLPPVPDDVVLLSCNTAPEILGPKGIRRPVDLYLLNATALENYPDRLERMFAEVRVRWLISRHPDRVRRLASLRWEHFAWDRATGGRNYLARRLWDGPTVERLASLAEREGPSSGVALVIHALVYGASEIHMIGLDLDGRGHATAPHDNTWYSRTHRPFDVECIRLAQARSGILSSVSADSPITSLLPHRPLR